jgi:hypothetical protein
MDTPPPVPYLYLVVALEIQVCEFLGTLLSRPALRRVRVRQPKFLPSEMTWTARHGLSSLEGPWALGSSLEYPQTCGSRDSIRGRPTRRIRGQVRLPAGLLDQRGGWWSRSR